MKRILIFALLILLGAAVVAGQSRATKKRIDRLAARIGDASDLSIFDGQGLIRGSLKIVIEYGIYDIGQARFEIRRVRSFKAAERWLKSREKNGFPWRVYRDFWGCRNGRCTFDNVSPGAHSWMFTQKILYGYRKKRSYIKAIYFLQG